MTVESSTRGKASVVKVSGRMTEEGAERFEDVCRQSLSEGQRHLVADLAGLEYVSSVGLRSFLRLAQASQKAGGALILCGIRGMVKEVFDMAHLTSFFPVFENADLALASLSEE